MAAVETDLLVIGGGATGAGVAWDAALRGLRVVLADRGDLATGTTGRFHGLLHSGGRYAVKDPRSARECAAENRILRAIAADCIEDTGGLFVATPGDDGAYADGFVAACRRVGVAAAEVPVAEVLRAEPRLHPGITRAFSVPDATIDAWKTVWACARAAAAHGAAILPYQEIVRLLVEGDAVGGAVLRDARSGAETTVRAACVVNAAGAWAGRVASLAGCEVGVVAGKGVMVAMNHRLVHAVVNRCALPGDGDILVPVRTVSIIGTTDARAPDPDRVQASADEVQAMLAAGELLIPGFSQHRALRVWAGVRPLFSAGATITADTRDVSRAHTVIDHADRDGVGRFLTITGGKFTTFRLMAEDTVDAVCAELGVGATCRTATEVLPDSEAHQYYWIGARQAEVEADPFDDPLVCECELVSRHDVLVAAARRPGLDLGDLRRALRLGMGPCQGGFCMARAAGLLHEAGHLDRSAANAALRAFQEERWTGVQPLAWGDQLRQKRLDDWLSLGVLDLEHLPA
ncbi:MAG TPA: anaerobic glycerol-3-phosphate dehydrogenase subunit GlpA [Candidatus Dormibacteraeota bacterium]|nr:anaerobic glycerol-3-phosphate dehydrogenase subunit GlpA [Candidatus Dormibacteraeota bacterium]